MKKSKKLYLAYGSNLSVQQMAYRCPGATPVGTGKIENYRLLFKGSGSGSYLTIEPEKGSSVPVLVWDVTKEDEINLDHYEGFPSFYYKKTIPIKYRTISDPRKVKEEPAFVYIMHEERRFGIPSKEYFITCLLGYRAFGFPEAVLGQALEYSASRSQQVFN